MTTRIRVNLALANGTWRVPLPTYNIVPGSFLPVVGLKSTADGVLPGILDTDVLLVNPSVQVDVPDTDVPPGPFLDAAWKALINARYVERAGQFTPVQR